MAVANRDPASGHPDDGDRWPFPRQRPSLLEMEGNNSLAKAIVATVREPLIVIDRGLRILTASRSFYSLFQVDAQEIRGQLLCEMPAARWDIAALRLLLENVISSAVAIEAYDVELEVPGLGRRHMLLDARPVPDEHNSNVAMLVGLEDVTLRRESDRLKDTLLRQQSVLIGEIQHRVSNSLQIIASILLLKARKVQSEETRYHLNDVHKRVVSIATVQRQLRAASRNDDVDVGPYLTTLCNELASSMIGDDGAVTVTAVATGGAAKADQAVSFGLIVTELVINALKHAFPDGRKGHIAVEFARDGAAWRLAVSDNGVGRQHTGEPDHVGLGTSIVEALAAQLKATVNISDCHPGTATEIVHAG